ncbi:MAG: outer membrane beta-barrel protein [Bdellovibrionota bacterium]
MRGSTFISNLRPFFLLFLAALALLLKTTPTFASDKADEYGATPFTEYGDFQDQEDEESDTRFFQYGRFFGVSLGLGFEGIDGNRGRLWQGGFPVVDFKVHYWFDFSWALDLGVTFASHFFETSAGNGGHTDVSLIRVGVNLKYYFDTKNVSAPISFANPFLSIGGGNYTKNQTSSSSGTPDSESGLGFSGGGGLEFAIRPKKSYFQVEGKMHFIQFLDTSTNIYAGPPNNIDDMTGRFYTLTGSILFTW